MSKRDLLTMAPAGSWMPAGLPLKRDLLTDLPKGKRDLLTLASAGSWVSAGSPLTETLQYLMLQTISKGIVFTWGLRPRRTVCFGSPTGRNIGLPGLYMHTYPYIYMHVGPAPARYICAYIYEHVHARGACGYMHICAYTWGLRAHHPVLWLADRSQCQLEMCVCVCVCVCLCLCVCVCVCVYV